MYGTYFNQTKDCFSIIFMVILLTDIFNFNDIELIKLLGLTLFRPCLKLINVLWLTLFIVLFKNIFLHFEFNVPLYKLLKVLPLIFKPLNYVDLFFVWYKVRSNFNFSILINN